MRDDTVFEQAATIANGGTVSGAVMLEGYQVVGIQFPAVALTGTSFTFQVSSDNGSNYVALYDDIGDPVTVLPAAGTALRTQWLDPRFFLSAHRLKVVSSNAEGAARSIKILTARAV
jgi:hypothetical protein